MQELDLLILGAGWTSTFLIPLLRTRHLTFAATTRDGRSVAGEKTIPWSFSPPSSSNENTTSTQKDQFAVLPLAKAVLITFPLKGEGQSKALVKGYEGHWRSKLHPTSSSTSPSTQHEIPRESKERKVHFIQLGSSGIWQTSPSSTAPSTQTTPPSHWLTRHSPYTTTNPRAIAEDELLSLAGSVLNLSGLWGGPRQPKSWVDRVAKTKEDVKSKTSLHMIHGLDVARGIVAVLGKWEEAKGERWMVTDGFVYDWWALFVGWAGVKGEEEDGGDGEPSEQAKWVFELMREEGVRALPRSMEVLGRCYDGREFWETFGVVPLKGRI